MRSISTHLGRTMVMLALVSATACSATSDGRPGRSSSAPSATPPTQTQTQTPSSGTAAAPDGGTRVRIGFGDQQVGGTVLHTPAGRALAAQLPLEVDLADHGGVEKTGPLRDRLPTDGEPDGADPPVGAIGYYAPNGDFVLYYGDQSYYPGIVVIGQMGDGFARLADVDGDVRVTVSAID